LDIVTPPVSFLKRFAKLAGVAVSDYKLKTAATRQLRAKGYTVINLLGDIIEHQIDTDPKWTYGERLGVYAGLSFMITDRFHGSILTLKQSNSPVVLVEPDYFYPEKNSKGRDLFERLGLGHMVWRYEVDEAIPDDLVDIFWEKSLKTDWSDKSAISSLAQNAISVRMPEIKIILKQKPVHS
jgi:hypothetical protein